MRKLAFLMGAVLILSASFGIMLFHLNRESFWFDEAWTAWAIHYDASQSSGEQMVTVSPRQRLTFLKEDYLATLNNIRRDDVHPPLYYLFLNTWALLFGESEFSLRLVSALWGMLALAGVVALGKRAVDWRVGLSGAVLLGTHGFFLYYAREARMYTQFLALTTLTICVAWAWWQRPTWRRGVLMGVCGALLLWTQYIGAVILATLALMLGILAGWQVLRRRVSLWYAVGRLIPFALSGLLFLPWAPFAWQQWQARGAPNALPLPSDWGTVFALFYQLTTNQPLLFIACLVLGVWALRVSRVRDSVIRVALLASIPTVILLAINTRLPIFQLRYVIFVWALGAVWVAIFVQHSAHWLPATWRLRGVLPWGLLGLIAWMQLTQYEWLPKSNWREGVEQASLSRTPQEPALVSYLASSPVAYYDRRFALREGISLDVGWRVFTPQEVRQLTDTLQQNPRIWLIAQASDPIAWDVLGHLATRGIGYRSSVNGTLFYRLDAQATSPLRLTFEARDVGKTWVYTGTLGQQIVPQAGQACITTHLTPDANMMVGVYVVQGYNTVLAQHEEPLDDSVCVVTDGLPTGEFGLRLMLFNPTTRQRALLIEAGQYWGDFIGIGTVVIP